jgi:peptide/nickel transport system ATP-binding protein
VTNARPVLTITALRVRYLTEHGHVDALRGIDFNVNRGESFGLVGESGSGKSTVLRVIAGLVPEASGTIKIDDREIGPRRSKAERRKVQLVFQDPYGSLHPHHTVERILREPIMIHGLGEPSSRIRDALLAVGLDATFLFRYPHQLSGGQRQRIAIARALIAEPDIVLLDEPTSALDVSIQAEILNLLLRLRRQRGLTYLLVSHDLAVVAHLCARLAVMRHGMIVEYLTSELLRSGDVAHPYTRQLLAAYGGTPIPVALSPP